MSPASRCCPRCSRILKPPGEPEQIGYRALAPVDRFLERHRIPVIAGTGLVALAGLPLLFYLSFDFNPINLRSPAVESVATYLDLRSDPNVGANAINVLLPEFQQSRQDRRSDCARSPRSSAS